MDNFRVVVDMGVLVYDVLITWFVGVSHTERIIQLEEIHELECVLELINSVSEILKEWGY